MGRAGHFQRLLSFQCGSAIQGTAGFVRSHGSRVSRRQDQSAWPQMRPDVINKGEMSEPGEGPRGMTPRSSWFLSRFLGVPGRKLLLWVSLGGSVGIAASLSAEAEPRRVGAYDGLNIGTAKEFRRHANVLARLRNFQWHQDLSFHQHFCSLFNQS